MASPFCTDATTRNNARRRVLTSLPLAMGVQDESEFWRVESLLDHNLPGQIISLEILDLSDRLEGKDPDLRRGESSEIMTCTACKNKMQMEDLNVASSRSSLYWYSCKAQRMRMGRPDQK